MIVSSGRSTNRRRKTSEVETGTSLVGWRITAYAKASSMPTQPLRSPNTYAKLATITTRTLVVAADADLLAPPALMKLWARHVKGAQWTMVPDAGHSIAWEQPAIFNDIVLKFLKEGRPFGDVPQ